MACQLKILEYTEQLLAQGELTAAYLFIEGAIVQDQRQARNFGGWMEKVAARIRAEAAREIVVKHSMHVMGQAISELQNK